MQGAAPRGGLGGDSVRAHHQKPSRLGAETYDLAAKNWWGLDGIISRLAAKPRTTHKDLAEVTGCFAFANRAYTGSLSLLQPFFGATRHLNTVPVATKSA